jgi:hypothetical protein
MKAPGAAWATGRESDNPRLNKPVVQVFQQFAPPSSALTVSLRADVLGAVVVVVLAVVTFVVLTLVVLPVLVLVDVEVVTVVVSLSSSVELSVLDCR